MEITLLVELTADVLLFFFRLCNGRWGIHKDSQKVLTFPSSVGCTTVETGTYIPKNRVSDA